MLLLSGILNFGDDTYFKMFQKTKNTLSFFLKDLSLSQNLIGHFITLHNRSNYDFLHPLQWLVQVQFRQRILTPSFPPFERKTMGRPLIIEE
jgi:hypothetical protein